MKKQLEGTVVSANMNKTVVVEVISTYKHPVVKKLIRRSKRIKARIGSERVLVGDTVTIQPCRPLSKEIHYIVVKKLP
jgi:small subunit ribosomal protein S17